MSQNSFERMGGSYRQEGDYLLPDVTVPATPHIGFWGRRRLEHLRKHRDPIYTGLLLRGTLNTHLEEIDQQAEELLDLLVAQMARVEGVTEDLKARVQMAWVRAMNNMQARAAEIVCRDLINT